MYEYWEEMSDGKKIHVKKWDDVHEAIATVQIAHGMAEHITRYHEFAQFLNDKNIIVYGHDHRGHGQTGAANDSIGYFGDHVTFDRVAMDIVELSNKIEEDYPSIPHFLIGHSMGSFLSRRALALVPMIPLNGAVLIGSGYQPSALLAFGKLLLSSIISFKGNTTKGQFANKLTFFQFNKKTANNTEFDWVCKNEDTVTDYIEDPYCGFVPSNEFFYELYQGISLIQDQSEIKKINPHIPLLFLTGKEDPATNYSKGTEKVVKLYKDAGIEFINMKVYPGLRHEILNEKNNSEIFHDIFQWLNEQITCRN
jgi:alpha-beta hydrolase superfamily lysophospholipase